LKRLAEKGPASIDAREMLGRLETSRLITSPVTPPIRLGKRSNSSTYSLLRRKPCPENLAGFQIVVRKPAA